ncbi:class I SAM-dependent methyltransferase [Candidatus Frankia nodulisporulans]|uniref:class I SAM-dependent methyltransferase n=1 Tax=Candidatus Frankia nodulisporulans TaxID=2060052 RepID=UPI0013D20C8E|nr:class I SAM-dependent methyltransferase [Candidatus Frankia nodulisporulans]
MGSTRGLRYGDGVLGGPQDAEQTRLAAMADVCDPTTIRVLDDLGVGPGWHALEVGAGGGSIALWLAGRVGATGHVVATDLDIDPLQRRLHAQGDRQRHTPDRGPLTVLRHDVTSDPPPEQGPFDLVHARFVLEHLPERERVLDRLVSWLRPGGTLVVESIARFPLDSCAQPAFRRAMDALDTVLAATIGTDSTWARTFPAPLRARGLSEVGMTVHLPVTGGANASALCWALTLTRLRTRIVERRLAGDDVLDAALAQLADPDFADLAFATVLAWGRAPAHTTDAPGSRG